MPRDFRLEELCTKTIVFGEVHHLSDQRYIIAKMMLTRHVKRLFLECGDIPIIMGNNNASPSASSVNKRMQKVSDDGEPMLGDFLREWAKHAQRPIQGNAIWETTKGYLDAVLQRGESLDAKRPETINRIRLTELIEIAVQNNVEVHLFDNATPRDYKDPAYNGGEKVASATSEDPRGMTARNKIMNEYFLEAIHVKNSIGMNDYAGNVILVGAAHIGNEMQATIDHHQQIKEFISAVPYEPVGASSYPPVKGPGGH